MVVITPLDEHTILNTSDASHTQRGWAFTILHSFSLSSLDVGHIG